MSERNGSTERLKTTLKTRQLSEQRLNKTVRRHCEAPPPLGGFALVMIGADQPGYHRLGIITWHGPTVAPWNHIPQGSPKRIIICLEKCPKINLSFERVLRASRASAHAETIGNVYSFAHAQYGAIP